MNKHSMIGDVRGVGLFIGLELVKDRITKEPVDESIPIQLVGLCAQQGVLIGRTNRSFTAFNNTLCLSPMLTLSQEQADVIVEAIDHALGAL
jgi:taurine-pyruvate aminotransferase